MERTLARSWQAARASLAILTLVPTMTLSSLWTAAPARAEAPVYNTPFITDAELADDNAMTVEQVRSLLASYNSYFQRPIADVDGIVFDPAEVVIQAARRYRINPKVILVTLEKENEGLTTTRRPSDKTLRFLTGCLDPSTAREQLTCTAERFRAYDDQLTRTGATVSGWRVDVPKRTLDGVVVTPASRAVAGQFTYTPYAGAQWGGNEPQWGGVYLFYRHMSMVNGLSGAPSAPAKPLDSLFSDEARAQLLQRKLG